MERFFRKLFKRPRKYLYYAEIIVNSPFQVISVTYGVMEVWSHEDLTFKNIQNAIKSQCGQYRESRTLVVKSLQRI